MNQVVISGISGRFPASNNVREFRDNLYNKTNMIGEDTSRWNASGDVTKKFGFMKNVEKFDPKAFNIHPGVADFIDPQGRIMMEHVHEALLDAGVSPESLRGTSTGVYVGSLVLDTMDRHLEGKNDTYGFSGLGYAKFSFANRISFTFDLTGPSMLVDTACSSSFYALTLAFDAINKGECESAIVVGTALIFSPLIIELMQRSKIINTEGKSSPFDKNAAGYVRAESVSVVYLQREKDAKRIYASIINSKTNNEGFKSEGQTVPSIDSQIKLYRSVYEDEKTKVKTNEIDFIEAHTTSTQAGDKQEITSIDKYFCNDRTTPLKIGSVKGNIGHTEGASGLCSLIKSLIMFENEKIIPNININELRDDCPALIENRIEIVQKSERFNGKIIGVNNFGILGSNAHAIFRRNDKDKLDGGFPCDEMPRLLTWSGRTVEGVNAIFDRIEERQIDDEFIALLQSSQIKTSPAMSTRGYGIFKASDDRSTITMDRQVKELKTSNRPIVFLYSGVGSQWFEMGRDLLKIPCLEKKIKECCEISKKININMMEILTLKGSKDYKYWYPVAVTVIQIVLTDLLKMLGVEPDKIIGHSLGELGCAYADNTLTTEEAIISSFYRGWGIFEHFYESTQGDFNGAMAAVGLGYNAIKDMVPEGIEIACHNSFDSCTISGMRPQVQEFVDELKAKKHFAMIIDSEGIPYHSSYIHCIRESVLKNLKNTIKTPKKRSEKWISTSVPKSQWDSELAKYSSGEYHINNMMSPVLFEEGLAELPENSYIIEIAPHGLLQSILRKSLPNSELGSLMKRNSDDGVLFLLQSLGKLSQNGIDLDIRQLYPKVEFPVSRGTEMISPLIKWEHSEDYYVPTYDSQNSFDSKNVVTISLRDPKYEAYKGHVIDGKILLPATGYVFVAWEVYAKMNGYDENKTSFQCENLKIFKPTVLKFESDTLLTVSIQKGSGRFEISDSQNVIAEGSLKEANESKFMFKDANFSEEERSICKLDKKSYYRELKLRGYGYEHQFRVVEKLLSLTDVESKSLIKNHQNLPILLDGMLQSCIIVRDTRLQMIPSEIRRIFVNFDYHTKILEDKIQDAIINGDNEDEILLDCIANEKADYIRCGGLEMQGLVKRVINTRNETISPVVEDYKFVPHFPTPEMSSKDVAKFSLQLLLDKALLFNVKAVEVDNKSGREPLIGDLTNAIEQFPMVNYENHFLTEKAVEIKNVTVANEKVTSIAQIDLLILSDSLADNLFVKSIYTMQEHGVLLLREKSFYEKLDFPPVIAVLAILKYGAEYIYILKKAPETSNKKVFEIPSESQLNFKWVEELREMLRKDDDDVVLYSKSGSGILGFFNCLKREYSKKQLQCVLIDDESAPAFDINDQFYKSQLDLGMCTNVYRNGKWGSYKHLNLTSNAIEKPQEDHCFVHLLKTGDFSSLSWVNGELNPTRDNVVNVHYSGLNFRDVMVASSRISLDFEFDTRIRRQYNLGFEFSGTKKDGSRVMGITISRAFSNFVAENESLLLDIPSHWTLEQAATVPLVYITVYHAFFVCTKIEKGKTILIHAGSGGLGYAAIRVAIAYGLKVFTTVSNEEKKQYLLSEFPELEAKNIGNSRDTTFEGMIMERTGGKGVNYVLNSLAEEKMLASIRCVADDGVFLEVGKFDMLMGNKIPLGIFLKNITFKAVLINTDTMSSNPHIKDLLVDMITKDSAAGIIKPLKTTVFAAHEVEKAFRHIASAKHVGKIVFKVRDSEKSTSTLPLKIKPRIHFDDKKCYILTGGTGGMGMEIVDWMVLRNCKKLILSSTRGITNLYQEYRVNLWKSYGVEVEISKANITTLEGCEQLLKDAMKLGPIGGIFNLAGVVIDGLFDKMTEESFLKVVKPKANATLYLDELSRKMCPELDHFVVFSSIACGYGNGGQTNYGFANSVMERIVEKRRNDGLPGKAIQWGPIADVGMMEEKGNLELFGLISQNIHSCVNLLDDFLTCESAVSSSFIAKEKNKNVKNANDVFDNIINILGVSNNKAKSADLDKPLIEFGLDSLTAAELEVMFERELGISLKLQDMKNNSLNQIREIVNQQLREKS